jgi:hypothetical protein
VVPITAVAAAASEELALSRVSGVSRVTDSNVAVASSYFTMWTKLLLSCTWQHGGSDGMGEKEA